LDEQSVQSLLNYVDAFLYMRQVGAEDMISFVEKTGDYGVDKPTGLGEVIALRNNGASNEPMTNQFLLEESPWLPLALLVVAAVIAWARRSSNSILVDILRR
jgi:hypothetical protein